MYSLPMLAMLIYGLDGADNGQPISSADLDSDLALFIKVDHEIERMIKENRARVIVDDNLGPDTLLGKIGKDYRDLIDSTTITAEHIMEGFQEVNQSTGTLPNHYQGIYFMATHPSVLSRGDGPGGTHYLEVKVQRAHHLDHTETGSMYFIFGARGSLTAYYYGRHMGVHCKEKGFDIKKGWRISDLDNDVIRYNAYEDVMRQIQRLVQRQDATFAFLSDELRDVDGSRVKVKSKAFPSIPPVKKRNGWLWEFFC